MQTHCEKCNRPTQVFGAKHCADCWHPFIDRQEPAEDIKPVVDGWCATAKRNAAYMIDFINNAYE